MNGRAYDPLDPDDGARHGQQLASHREPEDGKPAVGPERGVIRLAWETSS